MRITPIQYKKACLTPDTVEKVKKLEAVARERKLRLQILGPSQKEWENKDSLSAIPTGREVHLKLHSDAEDEQRNLSLLWSLCLPLGFMPWDRYPILSSTSHCFHNPGPWALMQSHLMASGRGEWVWPSFCAAAQTDVGTWNGNLKTERFVQAQLHRIGVSAGPVDGIVGKQTQQAIRAAGFFNLPLTEVAKQLMKKPDYVPSGPKQKLTGHLILKTDFSINSYGQIQTVRTNQGANILVKGTGRVVIDIT